jgi:hypothetical protein
MGPVQLRANGNVRIEGLSASQGAFGAQADRASYEQAKDAFVLEGTASALATLWQGGAGGVASRPYEARKIRYVRSTGQVEVSGVRFIEYVPDEAPQNARGPGLLRQ